MKRSGFKQKHRKPLKRSPLRARTPLKRAKHPLKREKVSKVKNHYIIPEWYKKLPYRSGDHGRGAVQKRCWRVVSQTFREYDYLTYGKSCPVCGLFLSDWKDGQLGHWLRYSLCNGFFKYERLNLTLICAGCNFKDDAVTLFKLGEILKQRHGEDVLLHIEKENQKLRGMKLEDWMFVDFVSKIRPDLVY